MTPDHRDTVFAQLLDANGEGICVYCKKRVSRSVEHSHPRRATLDHVVPKSNGGLNSIDNFELTCRRCNEQKGSLSVERFRQRLKRLRRSL